jgi:NAD(P)H dehydrogenase (quinone)
VLIVLCHPEKQSLNHSMAAVMKKGFEDEGSVVQVSDLHAMKWSPLSDRSNFTTVANEAYFQQAAEERHAVSHKGFNDEISHEMQKILWCDTIVFQTPIHWFGLPAMLKSWCDKVLACGFAYGNGKWYDVGIMRGKRAILSITTGAQEKMYKRDGIQGSIDSIIFPITHGIFFFCGFHCLKPLIVHNAATVKNFEDVQKQIKHYVRSVVADTMPEIEFLALSEVAGKEGASLPEQMPRMTSVANAMMKAWANCDKETYKGLITRDFRMVIPAYGVDISGFEAVWALRMSMGEAPLDPHMCDSHTFPSRREITCMSQVVSSTTGDTKQLSKCTFRFEEQAFNKVNYYFQENLFMAEA